MSATAEASAKPKRQSGRASKPARPQDSSKVKSTFYLTPDAVKRLSVHAAMLSSDRSALVEQLIADGLRRFVVSDRARPAEACDTVPIGQEAAA